MYCPVLSSVFKFAKNAKGLREYVKSLVFISYYKNKSPRATASPDETPGLMSYNLGKNGEFPLKLYCYCNPFVIKETVMKSLRYKLKN